MTKYQDFKNKVKRFWKLKSAKIEPVIIGATGMICPTAPKATPCDTSSSRIPYLLALPKPRRAAHLHSSILLFSRLWNHHPVSVLLSSSHSFKHSAHHSLMSSHMHIHDLFYACCFFPILFLLGHCSLFLCDSSFPSYVRLPPPPHPLQYPLVVCYICTILSDL